MDWLFSWEITSFIVPIMLAVGFSVLAFDDFRLAKLFFLLTAVDAAGGIVMWGTRTRLSLPLTMLVVFVTVGATGVLTLFALRYVDRKQTRKIPPGKPIKDISSFRKKLYSEPAP
jgi:hypothetical protein